MQKGLSGLATPTCGQEAGCTQNHRRFLVSLPGLGPWDKGFPVSCQHLVRDPRAQAGTPALIHVPVNQVDAHPGTQPHRVLSGPTWHQFGECNATKRHSPEPWDVLKNVFIPHLLSSSCV